MVATMLGEAVGTYICSVCTDAFASRNLLFQHIKVTGHAALKEELEVVKEKKGKKGRRKGKRGAEEDDED